MEETTWTKEDALAALADGHTFWKKEAAQKICEALGVPFSEKIVTRYKNQKDANPTNDPKGLWLNDPDKPCEGVNSLTLSNYVAMQILHSEYPPSGEFIGRGFGAQANAAAVRQYLDKTK